jgi:hypothetical protein
MRRFLLAACAGGSLLLGGCAKPRAHVELPLPELVPPPPPPRIVAIYDADVEEPLPLTEPEPVEETTQPPPPRQPRPRPPDGPKSEPARTEPDRARPPQSPSLTLKPMPGSESKTEASIRELLGNTGRNLGRVNYGGLDSDGRTQYNTARRFLQQAEDALKTGNLVFAGKLADKAATMTAVLVR